jgi:hypothetical protein
MNLKEQLSFKKSVFKIILLSFVMFLIFTTGAFGQDIKIANLKTNIDAYRSIAKTDRQYYKEYMIEGGVSFSEGNPPIPFNNKDDVLKVLDNLNKPVKNNSNSSNWNTELTNYELTMKYNSQLKSLFNNLGSIGNSNANYINKDENPVYFAKDNNELIIVIHQISPDSIYNIANSSANERAKKVLENNLIPSFSKIYNAFKDTEINKFGLAITYGARDFTSTDANMFNEAETIMFISNKKNYNDYNNLQITKKEFIKNSNIYFSDMNMDLDKLRKIEFY